VAACGGGKRQLQLAFGKREFSFHFADAPWVAVPL